MDWKQLSTDRLEQLLVGSESRIASERALQLAILSELDARQVAGSDGCRTLTEWVGGRLDVSPETAATLVGTARRLEDLPLLSEQLSVGELSFERAVELSRLATPATELEVAYEARGFDMAGLRRQVACHRRISREEEQRTFSERFLALQPSLDRSWWRIWGACRDRRGRWSRRPSPPEPTLSPASPTVPGPLEGSGTPTP